MIRNQTITDKMLIKLFSMLYCTAGPDQGTGGEEGTREGDGGEEGTREGDKWTQDRAMTSVLNFKRHP